MKVIVLADRSRSSFFHQRCLCFRLTFRCGCSKRSSLIYRCLGVSRRYFVLKFPRLMPTQWGLPSNHSLSGPSHTLLPVPVFRTGYVASDVFKILTLVFLP